jgi:ion channel
MPFPQDFLKQTNKFTVKLVERATLRVIVVALVALITLFGFAFWQIQGIQSSAVQTPTVGEASAKGASLWDAIYFSVVTISSLGYGDWFPIGWARALACLEVLSGHDYGLRIKRSSIKSPGFSTNLRHC